MSDELRDQLQAEQEQVNVLLGDQDPILVPCSNNETYEITRSKCIISVLASKHFKNMALVSEYKGKLRDLAVEIDKLKDFPEPRELKLKEFEETKHKMISEFVATVENNEEMCKGLAYVILNDKDAIYADENIVRPSFLKALGVKDKKKKDEKRLWYKLYTELDNEDVMKLFLAWTNKMGSEVFFYTMGLIQRLNSLKAQSPQEHL